MNVQGLPSMTAKIFAATSAALMLAGGAHAAGPICTVPGTYATIQLAVNDVGCSTINVGAGARSESLTIARPLVLNGANAGVAVAGRTFGVASESSVIGATTITSAGVTIDGFSLTNVGNADANRLGILIKSAAHNAVIKNNIVNGIGAAANVEFGGSHAIYLENGPDGAQITGNVLTNIRHGQRSSSAIFIGDSVQANGSDNVVISGNTISNVITGLRGAYGILMNSGSSVAGPGASGLQIRNNTIQNLSGGGWVHAIGLEGNTPGAVVNGNTITGLTAGSLDNLAVYFEKNPVASGSAVNNNNFTSLGYGMLLAATATGPVNGTCNWWGSANGPSGPSGAGSGVGVGPSVNFSPWLLSPAPNGTCAGGLTYSTCVAAVNAKAGAFLKGQLPADKAAFDAAQAAAKTAFFAQPRTKAEASAFSSQQAAEKTAFDNAQAASAAAFRVQNNADLAACASTP